MALASKGTGGVGNNTSNNQASSLHTLTTTAIDVGNLAVLVIAVDNAQTTDGDESAVSNVQDAAGNTWNKAAEFCNGQGAAQAGTTCSVWWTKATSQLAVASNITWDYSNNTSRDESCSTVWVFTADGNITVAATNTLANDASDPGSLDATTSSGEFLRVRGIASELNSVTQMTATASWSLFDVNRSGNVSTAQSVRGEFIISTGTGAASDPTLASADHASVYVAFDEAAAETNITPGQGNLALSGSSPSLTFSFPGTAGSIALSAVAPSVAQETMLSPARVDLTLSTDAPAAVTLFRASPGTADLLLSTAAPVVSVALTISPASSSLSLSLSAPSLSIATGLTPATVELTLSLTAPIASTITVVSPSTVDLLLSATAPSLSIAETTSPGAAQLSLSATAPVLTTITVIVPSRADLVFSAVAPAVAATDDVSLSPSSAQVALTSVGPALNLTIAPSSANLGVSPQQVVEIQPGQGNASLSSLAPSVTQRVSAQPASDDLALTSSAPSLATTTSARPEAGILALSSLAPEMTATGIIPPRTTRSRRSGRSRQLTPRENIQGRRSSVI